MTQKEKDSLKDIVQDIKTECNTLEETYLAIKNINFRWSKQRLEKIIDKLNKLS